jgi:GntR family transcriptional regulator, transcriptional repressor for pyruvate dehydrogenase complex
VDWSYKETAVQSGAIRPQRLSDTIVEQLEAMILEGTLAAGERLPAERILAERFGVSRPSLREAIQKLVARGLLSSRQGGGNYVADSLGSSFSDPLLALLEHRPEAHRDLLELRHTLEAACAYYAAQRATDLDLERLTEAYQALQACYARDKPDDVKASRMEEGAADARFHLAIAECSHNMVLLHTIRGLFDLLKRNVVTNIGGMYALRGETRQMLMQQHEALYRAIVEGRAEDARRCASDHIDYVQDVLAQSREEDQRRARAQRRALPSG